MDGAVTQENSMFPSDIGDPHFRSAVVYAPWVDSQATWTQRMTGINWVVPGLGSGSDYAATCGGASAVSGDGGSWVEIDVTEMAQAWVDNPAQNYGLLLRQASASGYVIYDFCSERGVSPCTATQTPQLAVWYR